MSTQERLPVEFEEYLNTKYNGYYEWCDKIGYYRNIETHGAVFEPELTGLMVDFLHSKGYNLNLWTDGSVSSVNQDLDSSQGGIIAKKSLKEVVIKVCEANK